MPIMTSQILKSLDFSKTKCYFENETFLFQIKKLITHEGLLYYKNSFVVEVTLNLFDNHLQVGRDMKFKSCLLYSSLSSQIKENNLSNTRELSDPSNTSVTKSRLKTALKSTLASFQVPRSRSIICSQLGDGTFFLSISNLSISNYFNINFISCFL